MSELELEPELIDAKADEFAQRMADTIVRAVDLGAIWEKAGQLWLWNDDGWLPLHEVPAAALRIELDGPDPRLRTNERGKVVRVPEKPPCGRVADCSLHGGHAHCGGCRD